MDSFLKNYKNTIYKAVPKKYLYFIKDYIYFVELGLKASENMNIKPEIKLKKFDLLYRQIFKNCALKNNLISKLQNKFIEENISLSLLSDMINIFKYKVTDSHFTNSASLNNYRQNFASVYARLIMTLNDLSPSVYIPLVSAIMCTIIITQEKNSNNNIERLDGLLRDAKILPLIIKNNSFRFKSWYFIETLEILTTKYKQGLSLKISNFNLIKIFVYASFKWLFVRVKTLKNRGI